MFYLLGRWWQEKFNRHHISFKKDEYVSYPYSLSYEMVVSSLFNMWWVSGFEEKLLRTYFSWTNGRLTGTLKAIWQQFLQQLFFFSRFKANYLEKVCCSPPFFFVDSNSPWKDLLFPHGPNLAQKPLYLVGNVLVTLKRNEPSHELRGKISSEKLEPWLWI